MKTVGLIGLMPFAVWIAVGCNGTGGTTATSSELVSQAVAQATSTHSAAVSCFDDFQTCIDAASGTTAPDLCKAPEDRPDCDGGMDRHGGPGGAGGPPPSPGPGGMGPVGRTVVLTMATGATTARRLRRSAPPAGSRSPPATPSCTSA